MYAGIPCTKVEVNPVRKATNVCGFFPPESTCGRAQRQAGYPQLLHRGGGYDPDPRHPCDKGFCAGNHSLPKMRNYTFETHKWGQVFHFSVYRTIGVRSIVMALIESLEIWQRDKSVCSTSKR